MFSSSPIKASSITFSNSPESDTCSSPNSLTSSDGLPSPFKTFGKISLPALFEITSSEINLKRSVISFVLSFRLFTSKLFSILLYQEIQIHSHISYALGKWMPPIGIEYIIDKVAIIPIIIISGISFIATIFAYKIMPEEIEKKSISKVYSLWLLAIAGLLGLVTTGDAFNLFVFLEISSLASVALVAMGAHKDKQALVAAYNYLIIGAVGATLYVIGVGSVSYTHLTLPTNREV